MARLIHESAMLPLREDGTLRLAVVSDTHSKPHAAIGARLAAVAPDAILHAGDIGELAVLDELAAMTARPVLAVRGNIDAAAARSPEGRAAPDVRTIAVGDPDAPRLRILLVHIAVYGPKLRADVAKQARAAGASLIVCGHSHVPFIGEDRGLTVFNPGSIGPRRFHLPIVFGTIDVAPGAVRLAHVDCETGRAWTPP